MNKQIKKRYRRINNTASKKKKSLKLNEVCSCTEQGGYLITDQRSKLFFEASLKLLVMLKIVLSPTFFSTKFWRKYNTYLTICTPR